MLVHFPSSQATLKDDKTSKKKQWKQEQNDKLLITDKNEFSTAA